MPRSKGPGRGTRYSKGVQSGSTIATIPSGVTLAEAGILYNGTTGITPTELGYLDGAGGAVLASPAAGNIMAGGIADWAGASVLITTGLSVVTAFTGSWYRDPATTTTQAASVEWVQHGVVAGAVTAALMYGSTTALFPSGGSLAWVAFGT